MGLLLDCLKEVGRWDLIFLIALNLDVTPSLPHTRSSFGNAVQCLMVKKCKLRRAHGQYSKAMSKIADRSHYRPPWEDRFDKFFDIVVHGFDCNKQSACNGGVTPEAICLTLKAMSAYFTRWPMVLFKFYQYHDARAIGSDMSMCQKSLDQFEKALPAGWCDNLRDQVLCKNRQGRIATQELAQQAFVHLRDLAVEMIGTSVLSSDPSFADFSSNTLYPIEWILYTSAYLKISSAWIGTVLDHALTSPLVFTAELQQMLLSLIAQHRGSLDQNYHTLSAFVGTELLDSVMESDLSPTPVSEVAAARLAVDPAMQAFPTSVIHSLMESVLLVALVVLLKCSSAQVHVSSETIRTKLAKYLEQQRVSVKTANFAWVDRMHESVRDELDRFKVSKINAFLDHLYPDCEDGVDRHDLRRLINQILS